MNFNFPIPLPPATPEPDLDLLAAAMLERADVNDVVRTPNGFDVYRWDGQHVEFGWHIEGDRQVLACRIYD